MIAYVLMGLVVLIGIYFYFQKSRKNVVEYMGNIQQKPFIASDKFDGAINGYVFKMGDMGLGYYLDH